MFNTIKFSLFALMMSSFLAPIVQAEEATAPGKVLSIRDRIRLHEEKIKEAEGPKIMKVPLNVKDFDALKEKVMDDTTYEVVLGHDYTKSMERFISYKGPLFVTFAHPWEATGKEIKAGLFDGFAANGDSIVSVHRILKK